MLDVLPLISGRREWRSMSQAAHDRPEDGSQRAERAAEVHASPASPWTAEEADQRWAAMLAESQRVRHGLAEGMTPEELGLRSAGQTVAELLRRRTVG
jgi:hypothetical protein